MPVAGAKYTDSKDTARSDDCEREKSNWKLDMKPSSIHSSPAYNLEPLGSNETVFANACNPDYTEIPKRHASLATWPVENLPSVDDLVRAGFFYTDAQTIVTCFYCNGSLQNWGPNDNPMIEHAHWFPHCAYAKQLCGDDLYRKIQESKRAQQKRAKANELREKPFTGEQISDTITNSQQLLIPDENTLSQFVAARLDLPVSQRLLDQNFKLSIIKRCWEDQLRLKQDDFVSECDLFIACLILQKQIEHIDGKKENIVVPSIKMKQIREQNDRFREHTSNLSQSLTNESVSTQSSIDSTSNPTTFSSPGEIQSTASNPNDQDPSQANPCVLCLTEERRLACIACDHLLSYLSCGCALHVCSVCQIRNESIRTNSHVNPVIIHQNHLLHM